jgi:hypothetical protein
MMHGKSKKNEKEMKLNDKDEARDRRSGKLFDSF